MYSAPKPNFKVSTKIYHAEIVKVFLSSAAELEPDPAAILEVQKAAVQFVQRVVEKAAARSQEKDKSLRLYVDDVLYQFRNTPKYLDLCARKMLMFSNSAKYRKSKYNKEYQDEDKDKDEDEDELIEMYQELSEQH